MVTTGHNAGLNLCSWERSINAKKSQLAKMCLSYVEVRCPRLENSLKLKRSVSSLHRAEHEIKPVYCILEAGAVYSVR